MDFKRLKRIEKNNEKQVCTLVRKRRGRFDGGSMVLADQFGERVR